MTVVGVGFEVGCLRNGHWQHLSYEQISRREGPYLL